MDTRFLVALGMLLAVLCFAMAVKMIEPPSVKDILISLTSGLMGAFTMNRLNKPPPNGTNGTGGDGK
jgi:hypothetical protein